MTMQPERIDELLKNCSDPREVGAEGGRMKQLTKAIIERCLEAEWEEHLGFPKHGRRAEGSTHSRNGRSRQPLNGTAQSRSQRHLHCLHGWMGCQGFPKPSRPSIHRRACSCGWCIGCVTRSNMSPTNPRQEVAAALKLIYGAPPEAEAAVYLDVLAGQWDRQYPTISKLWRTRGSHVLPPVYLSRRHSSRDLHPQRHPVAQHVLTQGDAHPLALSLR
jgi:transposase-like protein